MGTRKSFRVIQGGRRAGTDSPDDLSVSADVDQLLLRASKLRDLLSLRPNDLASGLVEDMEEAIAALRRLEMSAHPAAQRRAAEYRGLIAEIDAEIVAALNGV